MAAIPRNVHDLGGHGTWSFPRQLLRWDRKNKVASSVGLSDRAALGRPIAWRIVSPVAERYGRAGDPASVISETPAETIATRLQSPLSRDAQGESSRQQDAEAAPHLR